jgi:hypothetical protein
MNIEEIKKKFTPDYEYWFNNKDITETEAYLVIQGINPDDWKNYNGQENDLKRKIFLSNPNIKFELNDFEQYQNNLNSICGEFISTTVSNNGTIKTSSSSFYDCSATIEKEKIWKGSLYNLCIQLYERCYQLPESLLEFLDSKNKKPTHFDHYKNKEQYFADYNKFFDKTNIGKITKEEALYLLVGLNPEFAIKCNKITNKYQNQINEVGQYQFKDWDNEDRFFYSQYNIYCCRRLLNITNKEFKELEIEYKGFIEFIDDLYQLGYVPCDKLINFLKQKCSKSLYFNENGNIYKTYQQFSNMLYWSLGDLFHLLRGDHPIQKTQIITFFNSCSKNYSHINECSNDKRKYWALLKDESSTLDLEDFISKFLEKNDKGYNPKDLLIKVKEYVDVEIPQMLVDLVFGKKQDNFKAQKIINSSTTKTEQLIRRVLRVFIKKYKFDNAESCWGNFIRLIDGRTSLNFENDGIFDFSCLELKDNTIHWSPPNSKKSSKPKTLSKQSFVKKVFKELKSP